MRLPTNKRQHAALSSRFTRPTLWLLVLFLFAGPASAQSLTLFNWEEYMDPALLEAFREETGITVREVYYQTDELKNETLLNTNGGQGFDLIIGSGFSFRAYVQQGWLAPVDRDKVRHLGEIDPRWQREYPTVSKHAIPYFWGTVGIAYRTDKVSRPVTSWMDLFRPDETLKGRIVMIRDGLDTISLALKALGFSLATDDPAAITDAETLLREQRPYVLEYGYIDLTADSSLITGEAWMAMAYNGDALALQDKDERIAFAVPAEGTNLWIDYIAVLKSSASKDHAFRFIDFINRPRNAARLAEHVYYATPNRAAEKLLPAEYLGNPSIYPPNEVLDKSETYSTIGPLQLRARNRAFARIVD